MVHFVVCEAYFLGCQLFLQIFFPVMHSVILPRNDTLRYFEESQGTLQTMNNNLPLQIYDRKQYRFIDRLKIPDVAPWYWFSCLPLFTPVALWCAFWPVDSSHRLLFPENLVLQWISGRWPVPTLWPKGRGQETGFHTGGEQMLSPPKGATPEVTVSSVSPSSSLLWGWYPPGLLQPLCFSMGSCFLLFGPFCLL